MRNVLGLLLASLILARASASAAANDRPPLPRQVSMDLEYKLGPGTATCYDKEGMGFALIGALTYDPFNRGPNPEMHVEVDVTRRKGQFHADLSLTLSDGRLLWVEEQWHTNCVELLRNVAVIAAGHTLLYVLKLPSSQPAAEEKPDAPPPPAPQPAPPPPSPPPPARALAARSDSPSLRAPVSSERDLWRLRGGISAELSFGLVPSIGAGAALTGGVRRAELFSLNVDLRGLISVAPESIYGGHSARWYYLGGSLAPCMHIQIAFACPVAHVGSIGWLAPDVRSTRDSSSITGAVGGRIGVGWKVSRGYSVRTGIDLSYLLRPKRVSKYQGDQAGSDTSIPLAAIISIGLDATPRLEERR